MLIDSSQQTGKLVFVREAARPLPPLVYEGGGRRPGGVRGTVFDITYPTANTYFLSLIGGIFRSFEHRLSTHCGILPPPFGPSPLASEGGKGRAQQPDKHQFVEWLRKADKCKT